VAGLLEYTRLAASHHIATCINLQGSYSYQQAMKGQARTSQAVRKHDRPS
jgi:hypothetical protein